MSVATVFVLVWSPLAWVAARFLIVQAPLPSADAIVVLSGSATLSERADRAAELYNERRSATIVLTNDNLQSGWSQVEQRNPYFYERAIAELRRRGVPQQAIEVVAPSVSSTHDEAVLLRRCSETRGWTSILLVTSAYHSRRALWTFRRVFSRSGIRIGLAGVEPGNQTPVPATWWLHLRGWQMVPVEYLKMAYYLVRY